MLDAAFFYAMFYKIDHRRWDELPQIFDHAARYARPGYDELDGIDAIIYFYRHERIIASGEHHVEGCIVEGDDACCWGWFEGISRDGQVLAERFSDIYHLNGGKIIFRRTHFFRPAI